MTREPTTLSAVLAAEEMEPASSTVDRRPTFVPTLASVLRRPVTLAVTFLALVASAVPVIWLTQHPTYRARATVRVAPVIPRIVYQMDENRTLPFYQSYLNTQVSIIKSPRVLERVLDDQQVQQTDWYRSSQAGTASLDTHVVNLAKVLRVTQRPKTELVDVVVEIGVAQDAAVLANAVVDSYMALANEGVEVDDLKRVEALQQRRASLRLKLRSIEESIASLAEEFGTTALNELRKQLSEHVSTLRQRLSDVRIEETLAAAELAELESASDGPSPSDGETSGASRLYAQDEEWRQLERNYSDAEYRHRVAAQKYGEQHPTMLDLAAAVEHARSLLRSRERQIERLMVNEGAQLLPTDSELRHETLSLRVRQLQRQIAALEESIRAHEADLERAAKTAQQIAGLEEERDHTQDQCATVVGRLAELDMERAAPGRLSVVARALATEEPFHDRRVLLTILAVGFAMIAAVGLAYVRNVLDTSIQDADQAHSIVPSVCLGTVPEISDPALLTDPVRGPLAEPIRMIRTALLQRMGGVPGYSLLVTSPGPGAGKSTLSLHLAASFGRLGRRVLLIDGDFRRPGLAKTLEMPEDQPGLKEALDGVVDPSEVVRVTQFGHVHFVPTGAAGEEADSCERLAGARFRKLVAEWKAAYDVVIVDGPPVLPVADARILAGQLDGTLMSLRADHSRRHEVTESVFEVTNAGGRIIGAVLVGVKPHRAYRRYGYGYGYGYGPTPAKPRTEIVPA